MKKIIASKCSVRAIKWVIFTDLDWLLGELSFIVATHIRQAVNDRPGRSPKMGITIRKVKISLNDVGDFKFAIIQMTINPRITKIGPDIFGFFNPNTRLPYRFRFSFSSIVLSFSGSMTSSLFVRNPWSVTSYAFLKKNNELECPAIKSLLRHIVEMWLKLAISQWLTTKSENLIMLGFVRRGSRAVKGGRL